MGKFSPYPKKKVRWFQNGKFKILLDFVAIFFAAVALAVSLTGELIHEKELEVSRDQLKIQKGYESIRLIPVLTSELEKDRESFSVLSAIRRCEPLYSSWGGKFTYDTMNIFLNKLEQLAFILLFLDSEKYLDTKLVAYFYSNYLVDVYLHPHVKRYIEGFHEHGNPQAWIRYANFSQKLLLRYPDVKGIGMDCTKILELS